jgi:hypothetical protein
MDSEKPARPVLSYAIDDVAYASLRNQGELGKKTARCSVCSRRISGTPSASGLLLWSRGEELRFDEPPLCQHCATAIGVTALARWTMDEG